MANKHPAAQEDVYLNVVVGNILDKYNNTSYNLKLYMIRAKTDDGGGWLNNHMTAAPKDTVIIAQTGVTGVQLDNLSIDIVKASGTGNSFAARASFQLIQPGAADLLDQIQAAKKALGMPMHADAPLFLAIEFKGYTTDLDIEDIEGRPVSIAGPYIYKLTVGKISVSIDSTGSIYDFECPVGGKIAYTDEYFRLPKDMYVQGDTIEELVKDLEDGLKRYREENLKEEEYHDEIIFDLSQAISVIGNTDVSKKGVKAAEQVNRLINAQQKGVKTREEFEKLLEDDPESLDGGITADTSFMGTQNINMKEGTDLYQFFTTVLVMCDGFLDQISRKKVFDDPVITEEGLDLNKTFTKWYKIISDVEYGEYDKRRGRYAKKITYQLIIYDTADENQSITPGEFNRTEDQVTRSIKALNIKKAYHYLYTGLNDQILRCDIKYNAGQLLLGAPGAGTMGDLSTNANTPTPNIDANTDLSGKTKKAEIAAKQEDVDGIKSALKDPSVLDRIGDELGLSDEEKQEIANNEQRRTALAQTVVFLNQQGQDPLGFLQSQTAGQDPDAPVDEPPSQPATQPYKPEPSGYIYSADLLEDYGGSSTVIGENVDTMNSARALNQLRDVAKGNELDTTPIPKFDFSKHVVATSSNTSDGSPSATLFGFMFNNVNDASILIDLNLQIRGDPWYLGKPYAPPEAGDNASTTPAVSKELESKDDYMVYDGGDNYFLFTMQSPRVRDPDVDLEDNNTGYMTKQGTAFFLSGVYMVSAITANFSNGMFDIEMTKAKKLTALSLAKFDMTKDLDDEE